jgi:NADPH:quinone reductase-like Zn-dependent oxidoreductase
MKAAVLHRPGEPPRMDDFDEPVEDNGHVVAHVTAASINHLDLQKASGRFYTGPPPVPSVVGSDGVARLEDGRRVFFDSTAGPFGSMAERTLVDESALLDIPDQVDDELAAALGNSGLAAWLALAWKAALDPGETVLVLGATGAVGGVAVQVAKALGAGWVVAAGRDAKRLERLRERGADAVVALDRKADLPAALQSATRGGADVIVDPLWGPPALAAMQAAAPCARHVQVGHMAGATLELPATLLRSSELQLLGFAVFHAPLELRRASYTHLTRAAARGEIEIDLERVPLADVDEAWQRQQEGPGTKLVVVPGTQP